MKFARFLPALALAFSFAGSAHAEARQDFDLANKTGYEIKEVYVSPSKSDDWQNDVLGTGTLPDGNGVHVKFHRDAQTCSWDLKVVYTDDSSSAVWQNINLCEVEKITIHYNRGSDTTSATFD
jgi:hypothetical protein